MVGARRSCIFNFHTSALAKFIPHWLIIMNSKKKLIK